MNLKKELAKIIVAELCGEDKVSRAEEHFRKTVVEKVAGVETKTVTVSAKARIVHDDNALMAMALENGLVGSNSEFKRLLEEGAVYLNDKRVVKGEILNYMPGENLLRVGKRKYLKLV